MLLRPLREGLCMPRDGLYSAGAACASFTSLPLLSASSSESSREAPSMWSCRRPDRLEEKVMGPPLLQTGSTR